MLAIFIEKKVCTSYPRKILNRKEIYVNYVANNKNEVHHNTLSRKVILSNCPLKANGECSYLLASCITLLLRQLLD